MFRPSPPESFKKTAIKNLRIEFLELPSLPKGKDGNSKNQKLGFSRTSSGFEKVPTKIKIYDLKNMHH